VTAHPDGTLVDPRDGRKYGYLFWEAIRKGGFELSTEGSFCVAAADAERFLEQKLTILGLNWRESNDFIVYWLPALKQNPYSLVRFLEHEYTDEVTLDITPKPDTVIRVFMVFRRLQTPIEVREPELTPVERRGFVAVEWGGMDLDEVLSEHLDHRLQP